MNRRGFTILEVVLVLAILLVMAALAYPSIEAMYGDLRLDAAADVVRARWADTRAAAIDQGRPYRFAVRPGTGAFRIAPDTTGYWADATDPDAEADELPIEQEDELPGGVTFEGAGGGDWERVVTFRPDGTGSDDVEIVFAAAGQRPLRLRLRAMTGAVAVERGGLP